MCRGCSWATSAILSLSARSLTSKAVRLRTRGGVPLLRPLRGTTKTSTICSASLFARSKSTRAPRPSRSRGASASSFEHRAPRALRRELLTRFRRGGRKKK
eukprot:Amastigsp_a342391_163.p3 type:complete len:101 gc:universal Amastigsp_a342391_163:317-15(-)